MLRATVCLFLFLLAAVSCQKKADPARQARHRIDSLEKALLATSQHQVANPDSMPAESQMEQVLNLVKEYQIFVADYPRDTASPTILYKEAQIFHGFLQDYEQASRVYGHLIDSFPKATNRPTAFLLLANARQDAGDTAGAQRVLHRLMAEHPGTGAAQQADQLSAYIRYGLRIQPDSGVKTNP